MGYQSSANLDMRDASEATQRRILVETTIANEKKSVGIAYLLWFFFGGFGGHNYYVGKTALGMMQLLGNVFGWAAFFGDVPVLSLILFLGVGISLLVDLCLIPARINAQTEKLRERLSDRMIWSDS
jgi:TM2 domain-containing membrane protein YozV